MTKVENYVQFMEKIAADQSHGYSQANRWGPDYDCSSLVITALEQAGIPAKSKGAVYTGNMADVLLSIGFSNVVSKVNLANASGMVRGDILMYHKSGNIGHTAVYQGNGKIVHARGQSYGSSKTGDQGTEIQAGCNYYNAPWQYVFRYKDASAQAATSSATTNKTTSVPASAASIGVVGTCSVKLPCLIKGAVCAEVGIIQTLLNAKGYKGKDGKKLDVDNELGNNTAYAIEQLQRKTGMKNINFGTVAGKTWEVLLQG